MNQTERLTLQILTRITSKRQAFLVWVVVGIVILVFLYYNQREYA